MRITKVQEELLGAIDSNGGQIRNLFRVCVELRMDYAYTWMCLRRLESEGLVTVERRPGYPLVMATTTETCADAQTPRGSVDFGS